MLNRKPNSLMVILFYTYMSIVWMKTDENTHQSLELILKLQTCPTLYPLTVTKSSSVFLVESN